MLQRKLTLIDFYIPDNDFLDLSVMHLSDQDVIDYVIPFLKQHPKITALNLSHSRIGDNAAKALAALQNLTRVNLACNKIGVEGAKALAASPNLKILDLCANDISDEGAKALAALQTRQNSQTTIRVASLDVNDEGRMALSEVDPVKRANYARKVGVQSDVPSLQQQCLFKIKNPDQDHSVKHTAEKIGHKDGIKKRK